MSHAQLFLGREGSGSLTLALAYAQYVMCKHPTATDACGTCSSCVKMQKLVHPDMHFAFPVNAAKSTPPPVSDMFMERWRQVVCAKPYITEQEWYQAIEIENKQGNISVHEAENIIQKLALKSFEGGYKIMLLWLPERMNTSAANKLLKIIEEPPQQTLFLLVAENEGLMLKTILSRTQLVSLPPVERDALADMLSSKYSLAHDEAVRLAHVANGSVVRAHRMATEGYGSSRREYFEQFVAIMRLCYYNPQQTTNSQRGKHLLELMQLSKSIAEQGREYQKGFFLYALQMLRENFILNSKVNQAVYLFGEEATLSAGFARFINSNNVEPLYSEFNLAIQHLGQYGNPKIIFADLLLKISRLILPQA